MKLTLLGLALGFMALAQNPLKCGDASAPDWGCQPSYCSPDTRQHYTCTWTDPTLGSLSCDWPDSPGTCTGPFTVPNLGHVVKQGPFSDVTLGGDTLQPTLINHSNQPVIAYVIQRDTTTGVSSYPLPTFPSDRIMLDRTIKPGEESKIGGHGLGLTAQGEGDSIGYRLLAWLFADGTFVGQNISSVLPAEQAAWESRYREVYGKDPASGEFEKFIAARSAGWAQTFQHEVEFYRGYGQSLKTAENRGKAIYEDANLPQTSIVGVDIGQQRRRRSAGKILQGVLSAWGADKLDQALDRLASLPDVKGAQ